MGRRIVKLAAVETGDQGLRENVPATGTDLGQYWDRLKNLIPTEVSAIYIAGQGVIPQGEKVGLVVWAVLCLGFTILFMSRQTKKIEGQPDVTCPIDWTHVTISSISFVLWVYALGGPFSDYGLYIPWIGTLLILGWTFVVPYIYKGKPA
jgi:hypothetical protein